MEKPQSLADFLGVQDPRPEDARPLSDFETLLNTSSPKDFCKRILESREFRQYIMNGIVIGDLAPAVICRVIDHAWGKPIERLEVQTVHNLDNLSPDELRAHLQERIESLATMMRMLEPDEAQGSIH